MSRKALPSLDTLVFFEAVARHQSFSKAATELKVSQAAVSKRIATLESQLGYPLFDRSTRRPGLTDEGEYLFERTRSALTFLNEGLSDATDKIEPPVRVGTNNLTLSVFCLQDALHRFSTSENACGVSLISTYELDEVLAANLDIAVIYGDGKLNNWHSYRLMDEILAPVAAPEIADRYRRLDRYGMDDPDLAPLLLEYPQLTPTWVNWKMWLSYIQHEGFSRLAKKACPSYFNTIGGAIAGKGIALGSLSLLQSKLTSGELERVDQSVHETGLGYYLVHPADREMNDNVKAVFDFLLQSLKSSHDATATEPG